MQFELTYCVTHTHIHFTEGAQLEKTKVLLPQKTHVYHQKGHHPT